MKKITIDKKEYKIEFTIEASLYDEGTKSIMDFLVTGGLISNAAEEQNVEGAKEYFVSSLANIPQTTLTLFYAGLLEHHGSEGDGSILSKSDAKKLLATYLKESNKSFRDVLGEMISQMAEDNFFDLIGLNQVANELTENEKNGSGKK